MPLTNVLYYIQKLTYPSLGGNIKQTCLFMLWGTILLVAININI